MSGLLVLSEALIAAQSVDAPVSFVDESMPRVTVAPNVPQIILGRQLAVYEDREGTAGFDQIVNDASLKWLPSLQETPNYGYTDSTFWFKTRFRNTSERPLERLLVVSYPLLDQLTLYRVASSHIDYVVTGDILPFASRPVQSRDFVFPLLLPPGEDVVIYLRARSQGAVQLPISLWEPDAFHIEDAELIGGHSIYYGMLLVMVFYNLFLYFSIREKAYLYYVGFVSLFLIMQTGMNGVLFQYAYPDWPQIHQLSILLAVPLTTLFSCLFTLNFLNLKTLSPRLTRILQGAAVLACLAILGAFILPYSYSTRFSVALVAPISILILISGPLAWKKGNKAARYFVLAWILLLMGTTLAALNKFGLIPRTTLTEYGLQWGSAIEALLLSFALADRLNREREARILAQKAIIEQASLREVAEERLIYQATHHGLIGFPNATLLKKRVEELLGANEVEPFALVLVHLRRFHEINKTLGHDNADQVLKLIARRLAVGVCDSPHVTLIESCGDELHWVAHLDGVTFGFLILPASQSLVGSYVPELMESLVEPIEFDGLRIDLGVMIGVALAPEHGNDAATLMRHAQIGLDVANSRDNGFAIYSPDLDSYSAKRLGLMGDLRKAIQEDELTLSFQPQVNMTLGFVTGLEALVRWQHPQHGFIPPDEFIPMAEATGLIKPLTVWVLERAVSAAVQLLEAGFPLTISVNISAINLREANFVSNVCDILTRYRLPENQLILEITESAIMSDPDLALRVLKDLHEHGVQIAIDDFGTGHSSLSYIRKLPAQEIKIDRSFVMEMDKVNDDAVIVETTLSMCHNLGYRMVAEGIENDDVYRLLERMKCDYAQGYFMARPMPLPALKTWLMDSEWSVRNIRRSSVKSV